MPPATLAHGPLTALVVLLLSSIAALGLPEGGALAGQATPPRSLPSQAGGPAQRDEPLALIFALFVAAAVVFSRVKGLTSVVGLAVSILVLARFVVPRILDGHNPLLTSVLGAIGIALVSIYLAHGFSRRTPVALIGTLMTLGLSATLAVIFVRLAGLTGAGSEEAFYSPDRIADKPQPAGPVARGDHSRRTGSPR